MKKMKNYFIPHKDNDYKPHVMRKTSLAASTFITVFVFLLATAQTTLLHKTNFLSAVIPNVLAVLANSDRNSSSLHSLAYNPVLEKAAQEKANDMAEKGYFAHNSPEGITPWHWIRKAGYEFIYAGENLAVNFSDSSDVNNAWMNSPGHRANILNDKFTEVGIATARGIYKDQETVFVVEMFGRPAQISSGNLSGQAVSLSVAALSEENSSQSEAEVLSESKIENQTFIAVEDSNVRETEFSPESEVVKASWLERALSSPNRMMNLSFLIIGIFILVSLILMIFIEIEHQHPKNIAFGMGVLILILLLLYIYRTYIFTQVIVI